MIMSEQINELATALSKAQAMMTGAKKDSSNPYFKSKYADLAAVIDASREPLSSHGLAVIQTTAGNNDYIDLITTLVHTSGQWMQGRLIMRPTKNDPQGYGSAMTYARRYAYAAIVGLAQVDDDGNEASKPAVKETKQIAKKVKDEVLKQSRTAMEFDDEHALNQVWGEFDSDEKAVLWGLFNSQERSRMKQMMKGD